MQNVVVDKPYVFVPPYQGRWWPEKLQRLLGPYLNWMFGITQVECRGLELLRWSQRAGHGILIAPNHCHPGDPFVVSEAARQAGMTPYTLASWHLFMQNKFQSWILRRGGVFSIYREGMDRAAIAAAVEIMAAAQRPLVLFPEGVISRSNDRLNALMEGVALIARGAAKKRAAQSPPGKVVVHPLAIRYTFGGDIHAALEPALSEIEHRLSWRPQRELAMPQRIAKVGLALLGLKEVEYFGDVRPGAMFDRLAALIDHILAPHEREWLQGKSDGTVISRVKKLRSAILPDMVKGEISEVERERRWRQLADCYLAQQLSFYPPDYLGTEPRPDRMLETVQRFEEDLTDKCRIYRPMKATVAVGTAIIVEPTRERGAAEDPVMSGIESQLNFLLQNLP